MQGVTRAGNAERAWWSQRPPLGFVSEKHRLYLARMVRRMRLAKFNNHKVRAALYAADVEHPR